MILSWYSIYAPGIRGIRRLAQSEALRSPGVGVPRNAELRSAPATGNLSPYPDLSKEYLEINVGWWTRDAACDQRLAGLFLRAETIRLSATTR